LDKCRFSDESEDPKRHFIIRELNVFNREKFVEIVDSDPAHTAIVFAHGFNTSFKDGLLRLAQIVWDMQFKGVPVLFSWPSAGGVLNYLYDFNSALNARQRFAELIQLLQTEAKVETLHILAHSMGNFVVLEALNELTKLGAVEMMSEVIMAAPDVDTDLFRTLVKNIRPATRGMTLYASAHDKALVTSRSFAKKPRAGDVFVDGPILVGNVESIDVSAIGDEMFGLNHDTFAANRSLIDDIGRLVLSGTRPPDKRSPQIRCVPEGGMPPHYWRYAK
jgi:esterase/lipase superfamily enzyme